MKEGAQVTRDLAEERWITELADIYENAFSRPALIGPVKKRGNFYDLLQVSRPKEYPTKGKLGVRQIDRMLKRRKRKQLGEDPLTPARIPLFSTNSLNLRNVVLGNSKQNETRRLTEESDI